ncbi:MAG: TIGR04282 family arsenosugar biosynthesis glycosyltransferase [Pseudomonas sp.]|uniref:TIGR04282 family arsenosugar biosynthesis glycosyltransferase n=1 Tax=Pseudomonas sp. TaxID=306 RepID=UPI00339A2C8B
MTMSISLHLLAKAPRPGRVKTRLVPALGEQGASDLQRFMLERTLALPAAGFSQRCLWLSDGPDLSVQHLAHAQGWTLMEQPSGDLGERMRQIAVHGLSECGAVVLIGNDCPVMDGAYLAAACDALRHTDAVLGPAEDGGYVLLGLRRVEPRIFTAMPWGTEHIAALTRERLSELGWSQCSLAPLWDVDRPEDLPRLATLGITLPAL